jgi:hypothetical protein
VWNSHVYQGRIDEQGDLLVRLWTFRILVVVLALSVSAAAHEPPKPVDDPVQLKATIVKLQKALIAKERENGLLRATIAELQDTALEAAIDAMDPEVKKALGRPDMKATPTAKATPKP